MRGLALFRRTNTPGTWTIASWHSPHSLTWRWLLSISLFHGYERLGGRFWWGYRTNGGIHAGIRLPRIGMLHWQQQRPIWYRDLYLRMRDEQDRAKYEASCGAGLTPPPPVQVDGGISLH